MTHQGECKLNKNWLRDIFKFGVPSNMFVKGMEEGTPCFEFSSKQEAPPPATAFEKQQLNASSVVHTLTHLKEVNIGSVALLVELVCMSHTRRLLSQKAKCLLTFKGQPWTVLHSCVTQLVTTDLLFTLSKLVVQHQRQPS